MSFFFNDTATTEIYTLSLHDALPIFSESNQNGGLGVPYNLRVSGLAPEAVPANQAPVVTAPGAQATNEDTPLVFSAANSRSEEHTSELQSRQYLVCRLLLEKTKQRPSCFFMNCSPPRIFDLPLGRFYAFTSSPHAPSPCCASTCIREPYLFLINPLSLVLSP